MANSFLLNCIKRLREYGIGICMADQHISLLNNSVKGNVYTTIFFGQQSMVDIREIVRITGLSPQQADKLNKLPSGKAIFRIAARYPYSLFVKFPYIKPKYLTDTELDKINAVKIELKNISGKIKFKCKLEKSGIYDAHDISKNAKKLLLAVHNNPFETKTSLYKLAGLGIGGNGKRAADECIEKKLLLVLQPKIGKGCSQYLMMLEAGCRVIGKPYKPAYGRGAGPEHILYQNLIAKKFFELDPTIELFKNGKAIDLAFQIKARLICIEVQMSQSNAIKNIFDDFSIAHANGVIVVCPNKKTLSKVTNTVKYSDLPVDYKKKTHFLLISKLLELNSEKFQQHFFGPTRTIPKRVKHNH